MEAARQYVVSISAAAIFCGVVISLLGKRTAHALVKILCGTFLAFTFLNPIADLSLDMLDIPFLPELSADQDAVAQGTMIRNQAMGQIIQERTEDFIMDIALECGAAVTVEVSLSDEELPVPVGVTITGAVSPYVKEQLQKALRDELGILQEDQLWIG